MRNIKLILRYIRDNPGIMTVRPTTLTLEALKRAPVGSVLMYGDSDCAGDTDRFSVSGSGTASGLRSKLGWYPITASNRKQSTITLSSGEAELVAALSGACEGMSLRQQWDWLLKFGCNAEETSETTQQIPCCDSSAALGMIKRKGSTRKTRHIELKAFFSQHWSARPEVRLVQVGTCEMLAVFFLRHSRHLSRLELDTNRVLNRFELGRTDRAEEATTTWRKSARQNCRKSTLVFVVSFWLSFPELKSTFLMECSTKCALLRSRAAFHQRCGV